MYQTDPQPYALNLATDPIAGQQVYVAPWFLSYPGNSGGPLYVQFNGYYYPAGVYLGTLYNGAQPYASLVRAIDTNVVRLITLAATIGDSGTNNDGGVVRFTPDSNISPGNPGCVQFDIQPAAAYAAGARWGFQGDTNYSTASNYTRVVTSTNAITVEFTTNVSAWLPPPNQTITVHPKVTARYTAFYTVTNPVLVVKPGIGIGITGTTGTVYQIQRRASLSNGAWAINGTTPPLGADFNLLLPWPPTNGPAAFYRALWLTNGH